MLIDNILFLRDKYPIVRKYFYELQKDKENHSSRVKVINAKIGVKTLQYRDDNGKELMIHSKYDPISEANRIITSHMDRITSDTHVFFYGIGLGYHIKKFKELFPDNTYSVYEPVPEIFLTMANNIDLKQLITKRTLKLYIDKHNSETNEYLQEFQNSNKKIHIIMLPSYQNLVKEKVNHFRQKVENIIKSRRTTLRIDVKFQKKWIINSLLNFNTVLDTPNMLKDINREHFEGKPVIIVSAGPSLTKDIEYLRFIREHDLAYIFSAGSAINSLIEYDVLPDAVFTYDPRERNHLVFKKMIENGINYIPMVFGSSVGDKTISNYAGPKVHFITSQDRSSAYFLDDNFTADDLIMDSPSIAVMMFQLLNKLGASPIIFVGQNLGYLNERRYSEGIEYEHIKSKVDNKELDKAVKVLDVYGNEIYTNSTFNSMRESIEHYAKIYSGTFINTTKGGAAIGGVPFQPIEYVLKGMLSESLKKQKWWEEQNHYNLSNITSRFEKLDNSMNEFNELLSHFDNVLNSIYRNVMIRNKGNVEEGLKQFDLLYNKMFINLYYSQFLSYFNRVNVDFIDKEIKNLNWEKDIFLKGEIIVKEFSILLKKFKVHGEDLKNIIISIFSENNQ